jgi:hypothetical protein
MNKRNVKQVLFGVDFSRKFKEGEGGMNMAEVLYTHV